MARETRVERELARPTTKRAAVLYLFFLLASACTGPAGPAGQTGTQGEPGLQGATGPTGPQGPAGGTVDAGDPSRITGSITCTGSLSGQPYSFTYSVDQFANGNVFASGDIANSSIQASNAVMFSPNQTGYATAPVQVLFDAQAPADSGWWLLSLNRQSLVVTITYNDTDLPSGTMAWTMQPSQCTSNTY
jgi:hypothetical protein